jgi:hypothetical protein
VLAAFPDGASLEQIEAAIELPVSRRTLIRRLADMVERGVAVKSGTSRAARYRAAGGPAMRPSGRPIEPTQPELFVSLSKAGAEVLRLVSRDQAARKPVGYSRDFHALAQRGTGVKGRHRELAP